MIDRMRAIGYSVFLLALSACQMQPARESASSASQVMPSNASNIAAQVNAIADRYYAMIEVHTPERILLSGLEPDRHDRLSDPSASGLAVLAAEQDAIWDAVVAIDADSLRGRGEWVTWQLLRQDLANARSRRVCRHELWNVNQMGGWQSGLVRLAELQPVGSSEQRAQSLQRWSQMAAYIDVVTANLERGLGLGYSAPQPVVRRVIDQLDGLLARAGSDSPLAAPTSRGEDSAFARDLVKIVDEEILPAIRRHRVYLERDYLPRAREALSVAANPDGLACYEASLRAYTTLDRSAREVFDLGDATVRANRAKVEALGVEAYGLAEFDAIINAAKNDPEDRFSSRDEVLVFAQAAVDRAGEVMPQWVATMPAAPVEVMPFADHEEGTGRAAHYNAPSEDRPGQYRIPLNAPEEKSKGNAEATAFHETWPGHHLQVAFSRQIEGLHPVTKMIWFSGPGEGWARYSESLAEEMGLYQTKTGPIRRRAWPARGMVADPGLHVFGWTRERVRDYLGRAGRIPDERLDDMVDRIAILPGQLTAYDSGGLEIVALRRQVEEALGDDFDIRRFHDRVLENGTIPLGALREHIEDWLATMQKAEVGE